MQDQPAYSPLTVARHAEPAELMQTPAEPEKTLPHYRPDKDVLPQEADGIPSAASQNQTTGPEQGNDR